MDLKHLLKRGALLTAANWQTLAIQFVVESTFQGLLAVPILGAAVLVTELLGGDLSELLQGNLRDMFTTIAGALRAEPVALISFVFAFGIAMFGGYILTFLVKGGVVDVLAAASAEAGPIEQHPLTFDGVRHASRFTLARFSSGCGRLFRPYLSLGIGLIAVYGLSIGAYFAFVVYGFAAVEGRALIIGWTFVAALSGVLLYAWMTIVNMVYLLLQIAMAVEGVGVKGGCRAAARFIRSEFRDVAGVSLVVLALAGVATLVSALAWSGVGLIAFVPLVGIVVLPLQLAALMLRVLAFESLGLTTLGAYLTLYRGYLARHGEAVTGARADQGLGGGVVGVTGAI